ncbi:MAG: hypothetical protein ABW026_16995 [Microvirga sp.]
MTMQTTAPAEGPKVREYLIGLAGGCVLTLAALAGGFGILAWSDRLAAPPITKIEHLDEKLRFLRNHREIDPSLVVVGSSMAWRQFDGAPFAAQLGEGHVLNGATAFLKVHQTRFLTNFYMDHFPRIKTIMLMLGPPDFQDCTKIPAELFDTDDASGYVFEQDSPATFYMRYFSAAHYLRRARDYEAREVPMIGDLFMDGYGSGPVQRPAAMKKGLRYGRLVFDGACTDALMKLLPEITARGIRPVVVFSPVNPEFRRRYPGTMRRLQAVIARVRKEADPTIEILDTSESDFRSPEYFDAVHLQWAAVQRYSRQLARLVLPEASSAAVPPGQPTAAPRGSQP